MAARKDVQIMVRMSSELLRRLDALARRKAKESGVEVQRSAVVRLLLEEGLGRHRA